MATLYFNGAALDSDWATVHVAATGDLTFTDQPLDGETVTIDSATFEFDNDNSVTEGNISVEIGVDLDTTLNNLGAAITSIWLIAHTVNDPVLNLTAYTPGTTGNSYIITTTSTVITVNAMSGGIDGNWWTDSGFTTPATSLPTSTDDVVINASITSNSGGTPTVNSADISLGPGENGIFIDLIVVTTISFNQTESNYPVYDGTLVAQTVNFVGTNAGLGSNPYVGAGANITADTISFTGQAYNDGILNGAVSFSGYGYGHNSGTINVPENEVATFTNDAVNNSTIYGIVNFDGGENTTTGIINVPVDEECSFTNSSTNSGTINGGVTFDGSQNTSAGIINVPVDEECFFTNSSINYGTINGDVAFDLDSYNSSTYGYVNGLAKFYLNSHNAGEVESAEFYSNSYNVGTVNGDATFNDESKNGYPAVESVWTQTDIDNSIGSVNGTATFNDSSQNGFITNGPLDVTFGRCTNMVMRGQSKNLNGVVNSVTLDYPKGINGSSILGIV